MTTLRNLLLTGLTAAALSAPFALADDTAPAGNDSGKPATAPAGPRGGFGQRGPGDGRMMEMLADKLDLTEQQKPQFDKIVADTKQKFKDAYTQNEAAISAVREKVKAAREANDEAGMKAAMEEMKSIHEATFKPIREEAEASIKAILTPDQQAKLDTLKQGAEKRMQGGPAAGGARSGFIRPQLLQANMDKLNLTDDQKTKLTDAITTVKSAFEAAKQDGAGGAPTGEMRTAVEAFQATVKATLTADQLKTLTDLQGADGARGPGGPRGKGGHGGPDGANKSDKGDGAGGKAACDAPKPGSGSDSTSN